MRPIAYIGAIAAAVAIGVLGSGTRTLSVNPGTLAFGSQDISLGPTAPSSATLTSTGSSSVAISNVQITGANAAEFSVSANGCGSAVGSSCQISVTFDPSVAQADTATLTITDNASGSPHTVALTGTGTGGGGQPANTFYVRAGAVGSGNGSDWTNACTDFTGSCAVASLVRGDTYYVAAGTYAARTFNTAPSGTQTITIKGATLSDHGGAIGWNNAFAVGTAGQQAHWTPTLDGTFNVYYSIRADGMRYFIWDGNSACGGTAGIACSDPTTYGFVLDQPGTCNHDQDAVYYQTGAVNNDTFKHMAATACGGTATDVGRVMFSDDFAQATGLSNMTFAYDYCEFFEVCVDARKSSIDASTATNIVIDHLYSKNGWSTNVHHGEQINLVDHVDQVTLSNSIFAPYSVQNGTATVAANDGSSQVQPCANHVNIYGNVFAGFLQGAAGIGGNGVIASTDACSYANTNVYNNSFDHNGGGPWFAPCVTTNCGSATGNVVENNIIYNQDASHGAGSVTWDYNSYFSTTNTPTEAHGQSSVSNPFCDVAAGNYKLLSDTSAWNSAGIPAGDSIDPNSVTRTSSRGAYQFTGGC